MYFSKCISQNVFLKMYFSKWMVKEREIDIIDIICDTGWYGIQGKIEIEKKDIHDEGSLQRMMKEREIDGALYCDDLSQNVFLKMYFSKCISQMYFSNVFL